jgi:hypothetical protein
MQWRIMRENPRASRERIFELFRQEVGDDEEILRTIVREVLNDVMREERPLN